MSVVGTTADWFQAGLLLAVVLPLAAAAGALVPRLRRVSLSVLAPLAAVPALLASLLTIADAGFMSAEAAWPLLLTGIQLGLDQVSRIFLLLTAVLWALAMLYARAYLAGDPNRHRFFFFFLTSLSGNIGLVLARDAVSFYLFFALMSLAAYGVIVHAGSAPARRAGKVYIIMALLGEALLICALLLATAAAGGTDLRQIPAAVAASPLRNLIIALVLAGFGVKAGAAPLHLWLPLAHPVAPTPASAVLSGAMIKAGLLGWLRFLPLGEVSLPEWGALCAAAGLAAAVYGVVVGLTQDEPKTLLAYSSASQMGFMLTGIGIGLSAPEAWPAALSAVLLYALHHGLAKGALFLGVGVSPGGSTVQRWIHAGGLIVPASALAGAPFTSGAVAKVALKDALADSAAGWSGGIERLLAVATLGTALLMGRFLLLMWTRSKMEAVQHAGGLRVPWLAAVVVSSSAVWLVPLELFHEARVAILSWHTIKASLWPVVAGAGIVGLLWRLSRGRGRALALKIPAGDILAPLSRLGATLQDAAVRSAGAIAGWTAAAVDKSPSAATFSTYADHLVRLEHKLATARCLGSCFLFLR